MDYGLEPGFEPKHIDRKSIYIHLEARIQYLQDFLDWSSGEFNAPSIP